MSVSVRNDKIEIEEVIIDIKMRITTYQYVTYSRMLKSRKKQNLYIIKLSAISQALRCLSDYI